VWAKLPEIGGGMGKAIRNFKDASNNAENPMRRREIEEDKKA
jgi:sec-independent protein translocase protein TatA